MNANPNDLSHIRFISAGAGSGKTYRLTQELERALTAGTVTPAGVIGTTFTVKAASELRDRVRSKLIKSGKPLLAEQMAQALVGTVHSVCERLLARFAFELGLSPELNVASAEDGARLFNQALDETLDLEQVHEMNRRAMRLGLIDDHAGTSWQDQVKKIADQARSNDIDSSALGGMGKDSAARFLDYFPKVSCGDEASETLRQAIRTAVAVIDLEADTTKGTKTYVDNLRVALAALERDDCPWTSWISLSKKKPTKKSEPLALPVQEAAARYDRHEDYHGDISGYIEGLFAIAGSALARFQSIKTERGLIDYTDMEQLALRALDKPMVAERLEDELELLLVDEFQDTNPMQLALFMKLARFAKEVIFVGDVKQAIYGFRGTDPDLIRRTLDVLQARGATLDVLESSWRSRPPLVHYLNEVFATAFERDNIERALVELAPERPETHDAPAVMRWTLPKPKDADPADALAGAIGELVASGHKIADPSTGEPRSVAFGDIAVLATTNRHVEAVAKALRDRRVPMKMTLSGLLEVPEVCLAKACLRRLNDPSDTLATAEIRALGSCEEPEQWLPDRLRWLAVGEDQTAWSEADNPIMSRLASQREHTVTQSPVEIVARVLNYIGLRAIVTAWGPDATRAAQRQRNLDAFLDLAVKYEDHCGSQHESATLTGFLFWVENPSSPELDLQPVVTGGDAVHVLTYHRSKGLEWPVVVMTDFHFTWWPRLWDVRAESTTDELDLDHPLSERTIRFYPNVFGRNTKGVPALDAIMTSEEAAALADTNNAELRRLAYVGMTRARDTIAIAVPPGGPKAEAWMPTFESEFLVPTGDVLKLPSGHSVPAQSSDLAVAHFAAPTSPTFDPTWFLERTPTRSPVRERLSPSHAVPIASATVGEILEIGPRIAVHGSDMTSVGNAVHAVIASELVNPGRDDALDNATSIISNLAGDNAVAPLDAVDCARRLRRALEERFTLRDMLVEHPIELVQANGQVLHGWIDLLLETDQGWVIIDHKSSPRPRSEWAQEALAYSGQLAAYAVALRGAGLECASCWIHFAVGGGLVEVSRLEPSTTRE